MAFEIFCSLNIPTKLVRLVMLILLYLNATLRQISRQLTISATVGTKNRNKLHFTNMYKM